MITSEAHKNTVPYIKGVHLNSALSSGTYQKRAIPKFAVVTCHLTTFLRSTIAFTIVTQAPGPKARF